MVPATHGCRVGPSPAGHRPTPAPPARPLARPHPPRTRVPRADSSTSARFPAPPTNHPPSPHPRDRLNRITNRRNDREHDISHRRFGSTGPGQRTACPGTPTARAARPPRRPRAARVEPSPGRAPQSRRSAPASSDCGTRDPCTRRAVPSRHARRPAGLIAMGTPITEPPRLLPDSMGMRPAGASAAYGGVESAPADQVAALSSSPSRPSALAHGAGGATPSAGSASFMRSAMSSRLTRFSRGTSASGNQRASSLEPPTSLRSSPPTTVAR